jgi:glycosyltransferase involved in cell wall biosynthesis
LVQRVNPRLIYDLDDAIYERAKHRPLVDQMLRRAVCVVCGNETLASYARRFSDGVVVIPSVVDTQKYRPPAQARHLDSESVVIGWIGIDPNRGDLAPLRATFDWLAERYGEGVVLRVVSGTPLEMETRLTVEFAPWTLEGSLGELQQFDIGIMPLEDSAWNRAKCGFKLIQYMAVGAPAVASPVGVNSEIVQDGRTGYLATGAEEWDDRLARLIDNPASRALMGGEARAHVVRRYSVQAVLPELCSVLEQGAGRA